VLRGLRDPAAFRAAFLEVPPRERDAWLDGVLGLGEIADDETRLPSGCVPYLPCAADALLRVVEQAPVRASDVVVDVGAGVGRASAFFHLVTGAPVIGVEIQPRLARAARELASRLGLARLTFLDGDAAARTADLAQGTVFFLYCPFSGQRLANFVGGLEPLARGKSIRVACVDLPLPPCSWLVADPPSAPDLTIFRGAPIATAAAAT